jgi:hypothetical protein
MIACSLLIPTAFAESNVSIMTNSDSYEYGETVKISGEASVESVTLQIKDPTGKTILVRIINADKNFSLDFNLPSNFILGEYKIFATITSDGVPKIASTSITLIDNKEMAVTSISQDSQNAQDSQEQHDVKDSEGGGCLIATAAFGSEMAPQVQFLRELRDNTVLQTQSGTAFMTGFNQFYYSFSPVVADYERENPVFKEAVKLSLTPLLTSLTLLNHVDIDTEYEMLGYGIGVMLLNIGMYFMVPAVAIVAIKKKFHD